MSPERRVYLLDPQLLSPETIAVTFAKTSRSPQTFQEIAAELTDERSAEFHEKWVVGYGHASVAEHAVLHIAVENISRLAVECLESNRLASYTEKSTRYQKWGVDDFYIPDEIKDSLFLDDYISTVSTLLKTYQKSIPLVKEVIATEYPQAPGESDAAWERRIRSDYIDVCRYLLPAACLANVGITINARALEHALIKMLSHPLAEVRSAGEEIKKAARMEVPTLVKYAEPSSYLTETSTKLGNLAVNLRSTPGTPDWCSVQWMDPEFDDRLLTAILFRYGAGSHGYADIWNYVHSIGSGEKLALYHAAMDSLGKYDIPIREIEHSAFTFELILDQGAYFELKRHRMMTQSVQAFTPGLGYAIPVAISRSGLDQDFIQAMDTAAKTFYRLSSISPEVAAYVLPNAFNRRVLLSMNLRSAEHLVSLRSAPNAHFAMRRIAHRMAEEIHSRSPIFGDFLRVNKLETWQQVEDHYFTQTAYPIKG